MRDTVAPAPVPGEAGFTLVELLVSMTIFLAILAVTLGVLTDVSRGVKKDEARTQAAADAQVGVGRMVRELRAAYDVNAMSGTLMDVSARLGGQNVRLQYDCSVAFTPDDPRNPFDQLYRRCVRRTAPIPDPSSPLVALPASGTVIVDRICPGTSSSSCDS